MSTTLESRAAVLRGSKVHLSINTAKLEQTVDFYRRLFGTEPVKHYHDYAKFDLEQPGLNLAINRKDQVDLGADMEQRPLNHFGIELATSQQVKQAISSLQAGGFETQVEQEVTCCYGVQDKVWVKDPNGHLWEIFAILVGDTGQSTTAAKTATACSTTTAKPEPVATAKAPSACCGPAPSAAAASSPASVSR
jgi:catechol 2,3-dioxygenase-like lactoylglutathione lyase family enzyme